ncbi:MAG: peptidoglycan DD-metalloendopeptidase family protein [Clostridia bacterium]|nr:peptidoglycan DD-metalloendopeptidase family protein [Clostridia bacterium]MBP3708168.1 peptidoglycan DD-metalloendopeptidase family protein [Clostridia bacterium]
MKKTIFFIIMIVVVISVYSITHAEPFDEQKKAVQNEIEQSRQELEKISEEKQKTMEEITQLGISINDTQNQISDLENRIVKLNESIDAKIADIEEKEQLLDERLEAAYMTSGNTYLEALFNGGLFNFVSNYDIIKQIAEYDNKLISEIKSQKSELENSKVELSNSKAIIIAKQNELENQKLERRQKVETLTEEQKVIQQQIEEKEAEIVRINEAVRKATEQAALNLNGEYVPAVMSGGGMAWPTRIEHRVNSVYAPAGRTDTSGYHGTPHKGLDIYAPLNTPIYAAKEGTVVYVNSSGYGGGWGLYVVIYHGNDDNGNPIYTRYAHGCAIAEGIQIGSKVTADTAIMFAGNTGASEGAHLHFEVCVGDMYHQVDPSVYLGVQNTRGSH